MRRIAAAVALSLGTSLLRSPLLPATAAPSTPARATGGTAAAAASRAAIGAAVGAAVGAAPSAGRGGAVVRERQVTFRSVPADVSFSLGAGAAHTPTTLDTGVVAVPRGVAVVGATWAEGSGSGLTMSYRAKRAGRWSAWRSVDVETCADCAAPGARTRAGSEPVAVTGATHVQARLVTTGTPVRDARLGVVDPGATPANATPSKTTRRAGAPAGSASASTSASASGAVASGTSTGGGRSMSVAGLPAAPAGLPGPTVMPTKRRVWGATESAAAHSMPVVAAHGIAVHHTAGTNSYSPAQVPAILRGIQRFHTRDRGWSDIGYNALVDRYGRVWEGRYGGIGIPHKGAHASGVNRSYLGVAYIGDSSGARTTEAAVNSLVDVVAWTSVRYGYDVTGWMSVGGRTAPVVPGHYQVGNTRTSCPGTDLTRRLPEIRRRAAVRAESYRATARANSLGRG